MYQHDQMNLNENVERLTESVELIKRFPNAKIVYSGGTTTLSKSKPKFTGADVAKMFYTRMGVNIDNIIFENKSRNTYENFLFSKEFIENENNEKWLLVTSAFSYEKSNECCRKAKIKFYSISSRFYFEEKLQMDASVSKKWEWPFDKYE